MFSRIRISRRRIPLPCVGTVDTVLLRVQLCFRSSIAVNCTNVICEDNCCACPVKVESPATHPPSYAPAVLPLTPNSPVVDEFLSTLPPYSLELATTNASSPQSKALTWLRHDPLYNEYENVHRLNQRYALAVLYFSTKGRSWLNSTGWLSPENECDWSRSPFSMRYKNVCGEGSRLLSLDLTSNGLAGSIPTEMELLSDLQEMYFQDDYLPIALFPELYVRPVSALQLPRLWPTAVFCFYIFLFHLRCSGKLSKLEYLMLDGPWVGGTFPTEM
jgi:hypothetical protein